MRIYSMPRFFDCLDVGYNSINLKATNKVKRQVQLYPTMAVAKAHRMRIEARIVLQ